MQQVFSIQNVSYGTILQVPELVIPGGSIFTITGKSGSGKTTLLKLLNNLISCDEGDLYYHGTNVKSLDPVALRRRIVMVPQAPYIFPGSMEENIRLAFYFNRKEPPEQDRIKKMLSILDLPLDLRQETHNFSGGEKQRLALVRALLLEPETLLLDEPTAALDEANAKAALDYLAKWVSKAGKALVMVSHAAQLVETRSGTVVTLKDGKIERVWKPAAKGNGVHA